MRRWPGWRRTGQLGPLGLCPVIVSWRSLPVVLPLPSSLCRQATALCLIHARWRRRSWICSTPSWAVCLLALGLLVRRKSAVDATGAAFWRMCLLASLALALNPAGTHGTPWALALQAVALRLFGPALLALVLAFPRGQQATPPARWLSLLLWCPAVLLFLVYPVYWLHAGLLRSLVPFFDGLTLGGYTLVGGVYIGHTLWHPLSAHQHAQFQWLACGLLAGLAPFELLTLLPLALVGRALLPPEASILALAVLPLSIAVAIVHAEFLGITVVMRRRSLRLLAGAMLLAGVAIVTSLCASVAMQRWGWSPIILVIGASVVVAAGGATVGPRLLRAVEQLILHDVYDATTVLYQLSSDLATLPPRALGPHVTRRLCTILNLCHARLLAHNDLWAYQHPRTPRLVVPPEVLLERMRQHHEAPPSSGAVVEYLHAVPTLFYSVRHEETVEAVLCLGPKRNGERWTEQDRALVGAVANMLALPLNQRQVRLEAPVALDGGAEKDAPLEHGRAAHDDVTEPAPHLSEREQVILGYLARGLSNPEIAALLGRDVRTVAKHIEHIFEKLDAHNRTQAVAIARRKHVLPLE